MFDSKELAVIIIISIIFVFISIFPRTSFNIFLIITPLIVLLTNVLVKKIVAPFYNLKIKYHIWEIQRYGWYERSKFKKQFPIGFVLPFGISVLSLGIIKIPIFLSFNSENISKKRMLKKSGLERRSEINDSDEAFTAAWGFYSLLLLVILGKFELINSILPGLSILSSIYGLWNLLPIGSIDGSKLFFGSRFTWFLTVFLFIVAILFSIAA